MKLKSMYTCISRVPEADTPYESTDPKILQTKKAIKPNKRNALRSKCQPLSKSPKTPSDRVIAPTDVSSIRSGRFKIRSFSTKECNAKSEICCIDNNNKSEVEPRRKFSTDFGLLLNSSNSSMGFEINNDAKTLLSPKIEAWSPVENHRQSRCETEEKKVEKSSFCLNSENFEDLNSSQDDVFTGTDSPSWIIGEGDWNRGDFPGNTENEDGVNKPHQTCPVQLTLSKTDSIGNLYAYKTRNCTSVNGSLSPYLPTKRPVTRTDSLSSLNSEQQIKTSVDRATDSLETLRSLCANERLPRGNRFQQRTNYNTTAVLPPRRAFSTSPTTTRDIPPLIPPREPICSRTVTPQRHASSPSGESPLASAKARTRFSISAQNDTSRPKYRTQTSTTPVFSALPPSLSRSNPVIRPIMKDGTQASHTHYYLLGEDKSSSLETKRSKSKQYDPLMGIPRPVPKSKTLSLDRSNRLPPPRPPPPPASFFASQNFSEHDDLERSCSLPLPDQMSALQSQNRTHARLSPSLSGPDDRLQNENGRSVPQAFRMSVGEMIRILRSQVFGVTTDECQKALSRNDWNIAKTLNYLKIEQLYRVGLTSRENCQVLLQTAKWDLQSASQLLLEQHYRSQKTRS